MSSRYDRGCSYSLRLSKHNPQHIKVKNILGDLNPDFIKSRNQYIIDALEFYTNAIGEDDVTVLGARKKETNKDYIRRDELEDLQRSIINEATNIMQEKMIQLFGSFMGQIINNNTLATKDKDYENNTLEKELADELAEDDTINDLVSRWS